MSLAGRLASQRRAKAKTRALGLLQELREMLDADPALAQDPELDASMRELLRTSLRAQGRHVAARMI